MPLRHFIICHYLRHYYYLLSCQLPLRCHYDAPLRYYCRLFTMLRIIIVTLRHITRPCLPLLLLLIHFSLLMPYAERHTTYAGAHMPISFTPTRRRFIIFPTSVVYVCDIIHLPAFYLSPRRAPRRLN